MKVKDGFYLTAIGTDFVIIASTPETKKEFDGMLNAFRYDAPPHDGLAPNIDRIVMLLTNQLAIHEIIAFPLNQQDQDLLLSAPSEVQDKQLKELSIRLTLPLKS